jgi:diketogulonate reductase-like aldo/keto reductase
VESPHPNTMEISYNKHFSNYNMDKQQVIHLIHVVVWKQVYINYQLHHLVLVFVKENLKDHLHDNLKEFKIGTSNEEG